MGEFPSKFKRCEMLITDDDSAAQGGVISILPMPVTRMGGNQDLGQRLGIPLTFLAIGVVLGPPISGAIYTSTGGFEAVGYYAGKCSSGGQDTCLKLRIGSSIALSAFLLLLTKRVHTGKFTGNF